MKEKHFNSSSNISSFTTAVFLVTSVMLNVHQQLFKQNAKMEKLNLKNIILIRIYSDQQQDKSVIKLIEPSK